MPPPRPTRRARVLAACMLAALGLAHATLARADAAAEVRSLMTRGDLPAALQRAERALAAQPREPALRFLRAVVLMDLQRDAEALEQFTQLSEAWPELPDPLNNIAVLQARAGQLEQALQSLQAALRNDPGHRSARINLGQVHLMLAVQAWEQAAAGPIADPALARRLEAARALQAGDTPHAAPARAAGVPH